MQLISKYNKDSRFFLCVTDLDNKYAWVVPFKHKKGATFANLFWMIQKENQRKYGLIKTVSSKADILKHAFNTQQNKICCHRKIY